MSENARLELEAAAAAGHPNETGGILVGVHTAGSRPWIVRAVEVPSKNSGGAHYVIPAHRRREIVDRLRRQSDARLGYLGEWHTHPLDVGPSETDLASIQAISADEDADCARPILLIARRATNGYVFDAVQVNRRSARPLVLIVAGPLPRADAHHRRRALLSRFRITLMR